MDEAIAFQYDVALSFLQADEAVAQSLADALSQTCSVFVYSEQQRELGGKDGVDEFTAVFREQSRVGVILYREGWGATKWTRVEETAIKDRAFDTGWEFLTVVALGKGAPKWLPKTKLWLGLERFGVDGAVAVIEARVRERGGEVIVETARARAERLARAAAARAERDAFLDSERGVKAAMDAFAALREYVKAETEAMRTLEPPLDIVFDQRPQGDVFGASTAGAAFSFGWSLQYSNSLRHSNLLVQEFDCSYRIGGWYSTHRPEPCNRETWYFTLTLGGTAAWHEANAPEKQLSSQALAEYFLTRMLDRAHEERPDVRSEW